MLGTRIKDYMVPVPQTIGEDIALSTAMEIMRTQEIRHLPVQYAGRLVGVLSDRDVKLALTVHPAAKDLKVGDIMTEDPYAVSSDTPMADVLLEMSRHKYGCAIVTNKHCRAIGIFTVTDAVRVLTQCFVEQAAPRMEAL